MKNLKDQRTKNFPSTTRGGKELSSSSALDSPSVFSKLATPTAAIDSDSSHVIDDAMVTRKYRGSQQFSRVEYSTQIY